MAVKIASNFSLKSKKFLDDREEFDTILDMKNFPENSIPNGFITYNKETNKRYEFNSSNVNDVDLGKWRETSIESVDTITKDETKVITSGGVYNGLYVTKTETIIDTPAYYSVCQSTDDGALNVVLTVSEASTEIALDDIILQTTPEDLSILTGDGTEYVKYIAEVSHEETYDEEKYAIKDDTYTKTEVDNEITKALAGGIQVMEENDWNTYFNNLTITAKESGI